MLQTNERDRAADLLSQQLWLWGQDVVHPDGNWLTKVGFQRTPPPPERVDCSSVYSLELGDHRRVILRGFGVFIGDDNIGSLYLGRYRFEPVCSNMAALICPPWSPDDLPEFEPATVGNYRSFSRLLVDLLEWIQSYEKDVVRKLGADYRRDSIRQWDNGKRRVIPFEETGSAWERLMNLVAADSRPWFGVKPAVIESVPDNRTGRTA
ncbi:MAG TPA: hypothetical protein DDW52_18000 [Planctomycetaceae bacterium]|nr:hypothetical protein [Planctomycetaceae bacterium]